MTIRTDPMPQNEPTPGIEAVEAFLEWKALQHSAFSQPVGSREYFDEVEQRKHFVEPHIPEFAQFDRWAGKRVLEVGCGIGTAAVNFARAGADYTGIELSEASLELTRKRFDVYGLKGKLLLCNAERLSAHVELNHFGVIHHAPTRYR
jgi:2-polyprenyl-3-methyl-5-hydroxy-6-metoxy-1,4-benzoquinol methylase